MGTNGDMTRAEARDLELSRLWGEYRKRELAGLDTVEIQGMIIGLEREAEESEALSPLIDQTPPSES